MQDKALVFAGDKLGSLGIFDSSQTVDGEDEDWRPEVTTIKLHARTITSLQFLPEDIKSLYSSSYDSSIRKLDLEKGVAVQIFEPEDPDSDEGISQMQLTSAKPNLVHFTTLQGRFGIHDVRTPPQSSPVTTLCELSEKKIGGFAIHPTEDHILATASLDRTLKLWDLRKMTGRGEGIMPNLFGEHESRLSVSAASFNLAGQVATSSYDDTVKVYNFNDVKKLPPGGTLTENQMEPSATIPHNNQTGRWVTM